MYVVAIKLFCISEIGGVYDFCNARTRQDSRNLATKLITWQFIAPGIVFKDVRSKNVRRFCNFSGKLLCMLNRSVYCC